MTAAALPTVCECGSGLAPGRLACPVCRRLVHRAELETLAARARRAADRDDPEAELACWRGALELLPGDAPQHERVRERAAALSRRLEERDLPAAAAGPPSPASEVSPAAEGGSAERSGGRDRRTVGAAVIAAGLFVWKFKALIAGGLSKAKLLGAGLTKGTTLFSMLASLGLYWTAFGWVLAAGLIASIYVHEMGHVAALSRLGIRASPPMFLPGIGAVVRMKQYPVDAREDARVGLAGPVWGLGAALVSLGLFWATGAAAWAAIARLGAWINLFNLLPVPPLDGGRGFRALSRSQRWVAAGVLAAAWLLTREGLLLLLLAVAAFRLFGGDAPERGDRRALVEYAVLVAALSVLGGIEVPMEGTP